MVAEQFENVAFWVMHEKVSCVLSECEGRRIASQQHLRTAIKSTVKLTFYLNFEKLCK